MYNLNFERDLKEELIKISLSMGFKIVHKSLDNMLLDYLTVRTKIIEQKPRKVLINPIFKREIITHPKRKEIEAIITYSLGGKNLNPFQSKRLLQTNFHDHLQNEWNIFHFHLSLKKDRKSEFVKQVNSLLFAYINKDFIVFLGTDTHNNGVFGDIKWIEILHDFFPALIKEYRDETIISVHPKVNSVERQILWNKGFTLGMTEVRGVVYHNPGIGRMLSGHSITNSKTSLEILRWIYKLQDQVTQSYEILSGFLNIKPYDAEFHIRFGNITLELFEKNTNQIIATFPEILCEKEYLENKLDEITSSI